MYVVDTEGRILYANRGAQEMTGFTAVELTSMNMMDLNAPECAVQVPARIEAMRERGDLAFETKHITRNGGTIDVEVRTRTFDTDGQTLFLSVARDTTERKRIEEALRESEEEKHIILESTNELVVLQDTNHRIVWANQSAANAVGMEMDALIGQYCYKAWADRDSPCEDCPALDAISTGTDQQRERTDPQGRYWLASASPVFEQDGALSGVVTVTLDVTAQKMAEQELRRVQQEQQLVLDTTRELIVFHTPDLRVIWANSASAESVGQEVRDLVGKHCYEIWAGRDSPCPDCPVLTSLSTGKPETAEQRTLDGRHWMLSANVARNETGEIVGAVEVGTDITARVLAEQAVRETEEKYHSLVESINDVVYSVDSDGRVAFISPQVEHLSGIPPAAIVGRHFTDFVHPDDLPALLQSWERLRQGIMEPSEFRVFDVAGTLRHVRSSSRPHFDNGRFVGATCSMVEITERVEAERELRESESRYRELFEQTIAPMVLTTPAGAVIEANEAWHRLFGYSREDLATLDIHDTYAEPSMRDSLLEALARNEQIVDDEIALRRKDGTVLTCLRSVTSNRASDGTVRSLQSVIRDVTAQREAEREARASAALLKRGEQLSKTGGWSYEVATDTAKWTEGCYALHELDPASAIPLVEASLNCYAREDRQSIFKAFRRALEEGVPYLREADFITFKGAKRRVRTVGVPEMVDGKVARVVGSVADITEQHRATTALRESEERFRALFDLSMDPTCIDTESGAIIDANNAWLKLFGYTRDDLKSISSHSIHLTPESREALVRRVVTSGTIHDEEIKLKKRDGTVLDCLHSMVARKDHTGAVVAIQSVVRDITEKKRAEQALRESEERFRTLSENLDDAVVRMDRDFRLLYANPAMERVSGGSNGQFLAQLMDDSPESSQMMRDLRRDIQVVFDTGQPVSSGGEISLTDGVRVLGWSIAPERDLRGDVTTAIVSIHDVTDLRRAQEEAKESEARLRELAGYLQDATEKERTAIARDLHDHLGQGLTALRFDLAAVRNRINKDTGEARTAIENAIQMVDGLAADVRRLSSELRPGMLDDLGLCAAIEWHVGQFSERTGVACEISLPEDDSGIDSRVNTAAYRVLQELLTNVARHADATRVTIHMKREHGALSLTVRDNGRGISKRQLRSKESLGILGMRERIKSLGGDLTISGERGRGTTATVKIPIECPSRDEGLRSGK